VISVTRLNGTEIVVNVDLIETVEATPDTVLTLVDGKKYVVHESPAEVVERIRAFRVSVLRRLDDVSWPPANGLRVVPGSGATER
jgi:flagellar protein FlbD